MALHQTFSQVGPEEGLDGAPAFVLAHVDELMDIEVPVFSIPRAVFADVDSIPQGDASRLTSHEVDELPRPSEGEPQWRNDLRLHHDPDTLREPHPSQSSILHLNRAQGPAVGVYNAFLLKYPS